MALPNSILRRDHVLARTGLSRSSLYLKIKQGNFPKQVSLGERAVGWREAEVDHWINGRVVKA